MVFTFIVVISTIGMTAKFGVGLLVHGRAMYVNLRQLYWIKTSLNSEENSLYNAMGQQWTTHMLNSDKNQYFVFLTIYMK